MAEYVSYHKPQRRRTPWFVWELELVVLDSDGPHSCRTVDVGLYGVFVRTDTPAPLEQLLQVRLREGQDDPIEWLGVVRRVVTPSRATLAEPAGMGLEIFSIDETDWARWQWLIGKVGERAKTRPEPQAVEREAPRPAAGARPHRHPPQPPTAASRSRRGSPGCPS
jgi:hypothetical protein